MFWFAMLMVTVPGLLAFVFGWFAFRSRVSGVYFSIISQALTYALMLAFFRNDMGFGGNNGLTDFMVLPISRRRAPAPPCSCSRGSLLGGFAICRAVVSVSWPLLVAIRDAGSAGYRAETCKLFALTLSAFWRGSRQHVP